METLGRSVPAGEYLQDEDEARRFLQYLDQFPEFAFDTESTGLSSWRDKAVFVSLAAGERRACLPSVLLPVFKPLFENPTKLKIGHNVKVDMHWIANTATMVEVVDPVIDTQVMSIRENSSRPAHDLKYLASDGLYQRTDARYIRYPTFAELMEQLAQRSGVRPKKGDHLLLLLDPANRGEVSNYASMDAWATYLAFQELRSRLKAVKAPRLGNLWELYLSLEAPLTRVLYDYERGGFPIDATMLAGLRDPINRDLGSLIQELSREIGEPINPLSSTQVSNLLFNRWKYEPILYTSGGRSGNRKPSVNESVLQHYANQKDEHEPAIRKILECRALSKILGTYVEGILKHLDAQSRVHTTYNQGGTETGRLSSSSPNLQNIPSRPDKYGIRKTFRAPEGWAVIDFDFDQVEMKIMAALSRDPAMIEIINSGLDIHSKTAALVYGFEYELVQGAKNAKERKEALTAQQKELLRLRDACKTIGFGIMYGETERKLAEQLGISEEDAWQKREAWFRQFPKIQEYVQKTRAFIQCSGFVTSILGWRRYLPSGTLDEGESEEDRYRDPDFWKAMRAGVNMSIQGSAADCMKIVQIRVHKDPELADLCFRPLMVVHDEIVGLVPEKNKERALKRCIELARDPLEDYDIQLPVHITATGGTAKSWGEAKD